MSAFTSNKNPLGRYLENGKDFQFEENIAYHVGSEDSEEIILVPEGSVTDWASIPRALRNIITEYKGKKAAAVHDYLYRTLGLGGKYSRKRCDEIFLEALIVLGVPTIQSHILYRGVRLGGWVPWNEVKKQRLQKLQDENNNRPDY